MAYIHPDQTFGRPTLYTPEIADRICELVASLPYGLNIICKMHPELPSREAINVWRLKHEDFRVKYNNAKRVQAEILAESIEDIAQELKENANIDEHGNKKIDPGFLGQARLVCDNRKWTAARLAPKLYGDAKQLETALENNNKLRDELNALRAELDAKNKKEY